MKKPKHILMEADLQFMAQPSELNENRLTPALVHVVESVARKFESEPGARDGWESPLVPWKKMRETALQNPQSLQEAHGSAAFGQLMRAGIQMIANGKYKRYPTVYQEIAQVVASNKRQEYYAALFGAARPQEVKEGMPFREQAVIGQDIEIINRKFGAMVAFKRELFTDDQTGQIAAFAGQLGQSFAMWKDQYFSRRLIGASSTAFPPTTIEASAWTGQRATGAAVTSPFSSDMFTVAADGSLHFGNRPVTFVQFNWSALLRAHEHLRRAKDPQGQSIVVVPDVIFGSTFDEQNIEQALTSPYFPAVSGRAESSETAATAAAGFMRGPFSKNVMAGKLKPVINVHFVPGVWGICQAGTGFIDQEREPMEIVQEALNSGADFTNQVYRFRSSGRWEMDYEDPRFTYLGNDGTAALSQ